MEGAEERDMFLDEQRTNPMVLTLRNRGMEDHLLQRLLIQKNNITRKA